MLTRKECGISWVQLKASSTYSQRRISFIHAKTLNNPAYFSFCSKSRDLYMGRRKLSIEHLHSKAAWAALRTKTVDFKKRKISLDFFCFFFFFMQKKNTLNIFVRMKWWLFPLHFFYLPKRNEAKKVYFLFTSFYLILRCSWIFDFTMYFLICFILKTAHLG